MERKGHGVSSGLYLEYRCDLQMFADKSLINGVVFVEDVHATDVFVVKESAANLLVDPGIISYLDPGFIRQPLLVMVSQGFLLVDTKSHNIREPVPQGDSWGSSQLLVHTGGAEGESLSDSPV